MESLFAISGLLVLPFWALMIAVPRWRWTQRLVGSPAIVLGPLLLYAVAILPVLGQVLPVVAQPQLGPVAALLGQPRGATAAWMHFLAFDLFVARWIYFDARERRLPALLTSPILLLTLLLGPLGLATYLVVRGSVWQRAGSAVVRFARGAAAGSRPLTLLAVASTVLFGFTLVMQLVDARQVLGVSTWLKSAKFAASMATASITLAWMIQHLGPAQRGVRRAAWVIVATATIELVIITGQAARGVPSHFNNSTLFDGVLFTIMGASISVFWGAEVYLTWRAFRTQHADAAIGWGVRLGLVAALLGGAQGFIMPQPTAAQLATLQAGQATPLIGAHSVGAPDGGPGLPITRWNTQSGDLRVAHFLGLHGLQALPLLGWAISQALRRRRSERDENLVEPSALAPRLVIAGSGAYMAVMLGTLVQALQGRSVWPARDPRTELWALGAGALVMMAFALLAWLHKPQRQAAPQGSHDSAPAPLAA
jgi:hypothetical protein